jgi:hypothetical protein
LRCRISCWRSPTRSSNNEAVASSYRFSAARQPHGRSRRARSSRTSMHARTGVRFRPAMLGSMRSSTTGLDRFVRWPCSQSHGAFRLVTTRNVSRGGARYAAGAGVAASVASGAAAWVVLAVAWREQGRYLCFGSATPPTGCAVDSNRLASISKFATAHDRNPERRQQARAGDWCERDLHFPAFRKIFDKRVPARWPAIGRSTKVRNHRRMAGCMRPELGEFIQRS